MSEKRTLRCAIYTRKSTDEGLDQEFNSLDAQREAGEAYIKSQSHEGWRLLAGRYDDGGFSGGSMDRPGLQALLAAIAGRQIDIVVVYKIDRLTRSLSDFSRIVEVFEANGASFVSVTQAFNTTTSMGRLTLNVLLSFAQFEREVTAERIRDKIAASKKKGMWMGGLPPLGYDVRDRRLIVNEVEADRVRTLFRLYLEIGSVSVLCDRAKALGIATKQRHSAAGGSTGGGPFSRGHLYSLLSNPLYVGRVAHRGVTYPGQHQPIVDEDLWQAAQAMLADNRNGIGRGSRSSEPSLLVGLIFDETGDRLSPSHAVKGGRRYRYYISHRLMHASRRDGDGWRLPAHELERTVVAAVADYFRNHAKLIEDLRPDNHRPDRLQRLLDAADALAAGIQAMPPAALRSRLASIVRRIDLLPAELHMHLERDALWELLTAEKAPKGIQPPITVIVPITLRRRGVEAKLVVGGKPTKSDAAPDQKLLGLIIKAHKAVGMLVAGEAASVDAASAALGMDASDVTRVIPLAFLAPDITAAILDGRCPTSLTANRLRSIGPLPIDWAEQRRILEFAGS